MAINCNPSTALFKAASNFLSNSTSGERGELERKGGRVERKGREKYALYFVSGWFWCSILHQSLHKVMCGWFQRAGPHACDRELAGIKRGRGEEEAG